MLSRYDGKPALMRFGPFSLRYIMIRERGVVSGLLVPACYLNMWNRPRPRMSLLHCQDCPNNDHNLSDNSPSSTPILDQLLESICYLEASKVDYINREVCDRVPRINNISDEEVNEILRIIEGYLVSRGVAVCDARIVVCLIVYPGLTMTELCAITQTNKSSVCKSINYLAKKKIVISRTGKNFKVGRPYTYVQLAISAESLLSDFIIEFSSQSCLIRNFLASCECE